MNSKKLFEEIIKEIDFLEKNEKFQVKDLFKGYVWNRLSIANRTMAGVLFGEEVRTNKELKVEFLKKTSSKQQVYIKT